MKPCRTVFSALFAGLFGLTLVIGPSSATAQSRVLLVLPFENRTGQPALEWIREAFPEVINTRFESAGFEPVSTTDRQAAFDHLGLPPGYQPTHASAIRLAQTLDVNTIVVGSYITNGTGLILEAQLIDLPHLRLSKPIQVKGEMKDLLTLLNQMAWQIARELDPNFNVSEQTFANINAELRLDAFEQYVRGITEPDHAERLNHLRSATLLSPNYAHAWMALGREQYISAHYEEAANAFSHIASGRPEALEAGFYRGVALLLTGKYQDAEDAFTSVAHVLPLPEVLNNQAVAESRRNVDATELFRKTVQADASLANYHFNLAVSLHRHNHAAEAISELKEALKLHANDPEAEELLNFWTTTPVDAPEALERIERNFNAAAFRQAAMMLEQTESAHRAELAPHDRAISLATEARIFLNSGLLLEAERLFRSALETDGTLAAAHLGMSEIRERTGDLDSARVEAQTALKFESTADAWILLAKIDLAESKLESAYDEIGEALKLAPANRVAQELKSTIAQKQGVRQ